MERRNDSDECISHKHAGTSASTLSTDDHTAPRAGPEHRAEKNIGARSRLWKCLFVKLESTHTSSMSSVRWIMKDT